MNQYMVTIRLPYVFTDEFMAIIPQQRIHINSLMQKGILLNYSLAFDRSLLWATVLADSTEAVSDILREFPIYRHIQNIDIAQLAFQNTVTMILPTQSMN